jgi:hypothetical protein
MADRNLFFNALNNTIELQKYNKENASKVNKDELE